MNKKNKVFITASFIAFGLFTLGVSMIKTEPKTASALTYTTPKYLTHGSTNNGSETTSGCPDNFKIYMYGNTTSGEGTIYQNELTNWSYYYIYVDAIHVSDHRSFSLYKNGLHLMSQTMSGSSDEILYEGNLADGEYELEYTCRYAKNIFYDYTYYTYTYRFEVDKTAPKYTLMAGGEKIKDGSYTNKQIVYTATDANFACIRYKKPNATSYAYLSSSSSYTIPTTADNGWWYIYATDAMNQSNTAVSVYLDTIAPVGKVATVNGASVSNGGYTNREIKYWATDEGSGISYYEYKKPGATGWEKYKTGTAISGTGWHTFRACDSAGNYSEEYKVYYDAVQPFYSLYHESTYFGSGSYTNAEYVIYSAGDSASGLSNCWVKLPDVSYYSNYVSGTRVETEGLYYFYATDRSGNITPSISITIDKTKPTGTLYTGDAEVKSGTITNAENVRFIPYDAIGLSQTYVKKPDSNAYESYESGMEFTQEGTYEFYSVDKAMNVSETYTVTLDRQIPKAQLYVDEKPFDNNGYTNGAHIKFECTESCFVQLPNSDTFTPYISGVEYYKPGKYVFYGESPAGNSTGYYTIIIDRTEKTVEELNVVNGITDGNVVIDWTDGDKDVYAPIKSVSVNGKAYTKGQTIYTIDTGMYEVNVVDEAGNTWFTVFGSERVNVFTQTLQKEYYEAYNTEGTYYSFASYDSALAFAKAREKTYVRTGKWNGATWDTGMAMDAKDSVNAVNGQYFIYKKSGHSNEEVAYFTENRLNEVIEEYAKIGIHSYYYWEKEPTTVSDGENLFSYSDRKIILAPFVEFDGTISRFIDGEEYVNNTYAVNGYHALTLADDWGNTCDYELRIVRNAPVLKYAVGGSEGTENVVTFDRTYYFKDQVAVAIGDEVDEMAMFRVYDENGDLVGRFSLDEKCLISQNGRYTAIAINHASESETFELIISRDAPKVDMTEDVEKKQLNVRITPSVDNESHIQTLEIYKSTDGGTTWILLEEDDCGQAITTETLAYSFGTTATYKVVVSDEFRTGIDAITMEYAYELEYQPTSEPEIKKSGNSVWFALAVIGGIVVIAVVTVVILKKKELM